MNILRKTIYSEDKKGPKEDNRAARKYVHDIRNGKLFNRDNLESINNLSYEDRLNVLVAYNEMLAYYISVLESS